jgi:hypothetical protein
MRSRFILNLALMASGLWAPCVRGETHYVNASNPVPVLPFLSWSTAATNIQDAVSLATNGSLVLVTDGIYQVTSPVVVTNGVVIESVHGPSNTFLRANGLTNVVRLLGSNAALRGFAVEAGKARYGGGIYCGPTAMVISNCVIRGNQAAYGGGVYCEQSAALIVNCLIESNAAFNTNGTDINWPVSAGGGLFLKTANALLSDSVICANTASNQGEGGGIAFFHPENYAEGSTSRVGHAIMKACLVVSNVSDYGGGGMACTGPNLNIPITRYHVSVSNCIFDANSGQYGGAYAHFYWGTMPSLWNCLFVRNRSQSNGGAIRVFDTLSSGSYWARSTFVNNTVIETVATNNYAVYVSGSTIYMLNSILWSNRELGSLRLDTNTWQGSYQEIEFTDIEGGYNGIGILHEGNLDVEPEFEDYAAHDGRLAAGSPCIDAGDDLSGLLPRDLYGTARPLDGSFGGEALYDMGVHEYMHPLADSDGDGLRDTNEVALTTNPADADTDGDRMEDGDELLADTQPLNSNSFLGVTEVVFTGALPRITWTTVYGRGYRLQKTTAPTSSPWTNVLVSPIYEFDEFPEGTQSALDLNPSPGAPLYRIEIVP